VAALPSSLVQALETRYAIERELGRGGMATVYLARDLKHGRPVALKVLHPALASTLGPERFQREILLAAKLQHPHILTVLDSGDAAGQLWYTMPYVEGETLRGRLRREGRLPLDDALRIAREAAAALDYAHRHGVIHRDVKPENILLTVDGDALVADFGIARALDTQDEQLTASGLVLGTPTYMSPEQASGDPDIDARTDVYSLACVLYEMLAGLPPFTGPTPLAVLAKRLAQPAPPVRQERAEVPAPVAAALTRALARDPAERPPTAAAFAQDLVTISRAIPVAPIPSDDRSVAVLPLADLSPGHDNEHFSDGMTDELINALAQVEGLRVASRTSVFAFKGKEADIRRLGAQLNVGSVLEGSVRKAGSRLRVTIQLVHVADGYELWSARYERELTDVFAIQDEIA
jgi:eukaryotic-like serine/threonine-protein kinase